LSFESGVIVKTAANSSCVVTSWKGSNMITKIRWQCIYLSLICHQTPTFCYCQHIVPCVNVHCTVSKQLSLLQYEQHISFHVLFISTYSSLEVKHTYFNLVLFLLFNIPLSRFVLILLWTCFKYVVLGSFVTLKCSFLHPYVTSTLSQALRINSISWTILN